MTKFDGIKNGDRVKITFEAICRSTGGRYEVEGQDGDVMFSHNAQNAPAFQIERIEPPLAKGDRVTWGEGPTRRGVVLAVDERDAFVRNEYEVACVKFLSDLERIA